MPTPDKPDVYVKDHPGTGEQMRREASSPAQAVDLVALGWRKQGEDTRASRPARASKSAPTQSSTPARADGADHAAKS